MKSKFNRTNQTIGMLMAAFLALAVWQPKAQAAVAASGGYVQVNLVSDISSNAPHTDHQLVNPWGIVTGPQAVWVNNNGTSLAKAYGPFGGIFNFAIHVLAPGGGQGTPSGLAFNDTLQFVVTNGTRHAPSTFLMATEDGTITAWNHAVTGTNAVIVVDNSGSGAVYKGLAIARDTNGAPQIFAANFHAGTVDVFDGHFQPVTSFTDTNLPPLFAPFNVAIIRGRLFVTFAKQKLPDMHDDDAGPGNGFVDIFDTDGTLLRSFASGGVLNSPWGIAGAPQNFGKFSDALLVGNFGDGMINAYDIITGKLLGHLTKPSGEDVVIPGLWGLAFEWEPAFERGCDFDPERLYFTAGINDEADGLFGFLKQAGLRH